MSHILPRSPRTYVTPHGVSSMNCAQAPRALAAPARKPMESGSRPLDPDSTTRPSLRLACGSRLLNSVFAPIDHGRQYKVS